MEETGIDGTGVAGRCRLEILGPLRGRSNGIDLYLGPQRPQQVLAHLLASPARTASATRILDEVWGRDPDRNGLDLLKNAVYQLNRKFLSEFDCRVLVNTGAHGYAVADDVEVDVDEFELIRTQLTSGSLDDDPRATFQLSTSAAELWRDKEALPGFEDIPTVADYARRLAAGRLTVQRLRFEAALMLGAAEALLPELREAAAAHETDESIQALLMLALARSGRQTDALRSYDDFRRAQIESTGIEPSSELQQLHLDILARRDRASWNPRRRPLESRPPQIQRSAPSLLDEFQHLRHRPFVGRSDELAQLAAVVDDRRRSGRVCVVAGPAGIGKSSLIAAHFQRAGTMTDAVLFGRSSRERTGPLEPFRAELTATGGSDALLHMLGAPEPAGSLGTNNERDLGKEVDRWVDGAALELERRHGGSDLLIVLEDVQWVDHASLALIDRLASSTELRVGVILSCRRDDVVGSSLTERFDRWLADREHELIELGPLTTGDIGDLVSASLPSELLHRGDAIAGLARRLTGGNPMLLTDVLRSIEREAERLDAFSLAHLEAEVPESLAIGVHRRLLRLDRDDREAVKAAAVAGSTFDVDVVAEALGRDVDAVVAALEASRDEGFVVEIGGRLGRYRFSHDLVRQSVLDQIGINHRTRLHRRLAAVVSTDPNREDLHIRALHLLGALPLGDPAVAVATAIEAALDAVDSLDIDGALELLGTGLRAARRNQVDPLLVCDLLTTLATVQSWGGEPEGARLTIRDALDAARAGGDAERFATAVLAAGTDYRVVLSSSSFADLLFEAAERLRTQRQSPLAISVDATMLAQSVMPGRHRPTNLEAADLLTRARSSGSTAALLDALYATHVAARTDDPDIADRRRRADEIVATADRVPGLLHHLARGHSCRVYDLVSSGDFEEALAAAIYLGSLADDMSMPRYQWRSIVMRAGIERALGNDRDADELASSALSVGRSFDPIDAEAVFAMQMHESLWHSESLGALVDGLTQAASLSSVLAVKLLLAQALSADDDRRAARGHWQAHRDEVLGMSGEELWLPTKALAADLVARRVADRASAEILYAQLAPFCDQWVAVGVPLATWGPVIAYLGVLSSVLGQRTRAAEEFALAADRCRSAGARSWVTMVERWQARAEEEAAG